MRDGHDGYDGGFWDTPSHRHRHRECMRNRRLCLKCGSEVTVMAFVLGHPAAATPFGRTPHKRKMQAWDLLALSASCKATPAVRKNPPDFSDCVYRV